MPAREYFSVELEMIKNEEIREFTAKMLELAPQYFFHVASSSSGKYHPPQSSGEGGLLRHTRSVIYFADRLCTMEDITGDDRDAILSACLLHDICKYGLPGGKHTISTHDFVGAFFINAQAKSLGYEEAEWLKPILSAVVNHYGRWTKRDYNCKQPIKKFPEEYTTVDRIVHTADYISASSEVSLSFLNESSFIG